MNKKTYLIVFIASLVIVTMGFGFVLLKKDNTKQFNPSKYYLYEIYGFVDKSNTEASCDALTPSCGYCNGDIIEGRCYVNQQQYDEYRYIYPDLSVIVTD